MIRLNFLKRFNIRKAAFLICIASAAVALFAVSYSVGANYSSKETPEPEKSVFKTTYNDKPEYINEIIVYDILHRMANSKIAKESKDKSGKLEMTSNQIQAVKGIVEKMDYKDRGYLLQVLKRWEKGDFSFIEGEHEYFYGRFNADNKK